MLIADRVKQTLTANLKEPNKAEEFAKLQEFYQEMQRAGIARKQTYSLPPLDTVGRRLHQISTSKVSR